MIDRILSRLEKWMAAKQAQKAQKSPIARLVDARARGARISIEEDAIYAIYAATDGRYGAKSKRVFISGYILCNDNSIVLTGGR